jgi:hypothetical protein
MRQWLPLRRWRIAMRNGTTSLFRLGWLRGDSVAVA